MSISAINGNTSNYSNIASGKRIHSAADDASGMAIANKLKSQSNGYDVGASNIQDGIGVANTKDGALASIQDSLQRVHDLSLKASNGLNGDSEKQMIQDEIGQLLQGVEETAKGTTFNERKLLDGSMADINIASNPDGSGMKIGMENTTLQSLGLEGYDVTGDFDIGAVESAMEKISAARSNTGAATNVMEKAYQFNISSSEQLTGATSRIEDLDIPQAISEQKKDQLLQDYQTGMLKQKLNDDGLVLKLFQ